MKRPGNSPVVYVPIFRKRAKELVTKDRGSENRRIEESARQDDLVRILLMPSGMAFKSGGNPFQGERVVNPQQAKIVGFSP
jgi:hypothetical protein